MLNLTPLKKQRFAQHFMVAGIRQGLSNNNILDQLQAVGLGYRRQVFLRDMRRIRRFKPRQPPMTRAEKDNYLSSNRTLGMLGRGRTKFQYVFRVPMRDPISNKIIERKSISFISSRELIADVAFKIAETAIPLQGTDPNQPDFNHVNELTQVVWRPGIESYE